MLKPFFDYIEKIISDFSWKRLGILILIILFVTGGVVFYEAYTDHFKLSRMEKITELMEDIAFLQKEYRISQDIHLKRSYESLITAFNQIFEGDNSKTFIFNEKLRFAFSASALWLIFSLIFVSDVINRKKNSFQGMILALAFGVFFSIIGFHLPKLMKGYFNYIIYPVGHFGIVIGIVMLYGKTKKK